MLEQFAGAGHWRGVAAQERAARAVAAAVRTSIPNIASFVYCNLGKAYHVQGDFRKAIEYHVQHLAIAKEMEHRAGEGNGYGNLGTRISRRGTSARPSSTTRSAWRLQRRWATGRGRAGHTGTSATRMSRRVTSARPSSTTLRTWRLQRR